MQIDYIFKYLTISKLKNIVGRKIIIGGEQ